MVSDIPPEEELAAEGIIRSDLRLHEREWRRAGQLACSLLSLGEMIKQEFGMDKISRQAGVEGVVGMGRRWGG